VSKNNAGSEAPGGSPKSISSPFTRAAEVMARSNRMPGNVRQLGVSGVFFPVGRGFSFRVQPQRRQ